MTIGWRRDLFCQGWTNIDKIFLNLLTISCLLEIVSIFNWNESTKFKLLVLFIICLMICKVFLYYRLRIQILMHNIFFCNSYQFAKHISVHLIFIFICNIRVFKCRVEFFLFRQHRSKPVVIHSLRGVFYEKC